MKKALHIIKKVIIWVVIIWLVLFAGSFLFGVIYSLLGPIFHLPVLYY